LYQAQDKHLIVAENDVTYKLQAIYPLVYNENKQKTPWSMTCHLSKWSKT